MSTPENHTRQFTGVFIPASVWLNKELTCVEKCLLAEIDALGGRDGNCYASNEYLGATVGLSGVRAASIISKLKRLGLVRQVKFDGRNRWLKTMFILGSITLKSIEQSNRKREGRVIENDKAAYSKTSSKSTKEEENTNREKEGAAAPSLVKERAASNPLLPDSLCTDRFLGVWAEWVDERKRRGKALTPRAMELQLAFLSKLGEDDACESIHQSILNGWQGLFPPRGSEARMLAPRKRGEHVEGEYGPVLK